MMPTQEDLSRDLVADLRIVCGLRVGNTLTEWAVLAMKAAIRRALAAEGELLRLNGMAQHDREEAGRDS